MGTSLIRKNPSLGPYSRPVPRAPIVVLGGGAVSYERGTPVGAVVETPPSFLFVRWLQSTNGFKVSWSRHMYRGTSLIRNSPPPLGPP